MAFENSRDKEEPANGWVERLFEDEDVDKHEMHYCQHILYLVHKSILQIKHRSEIFCNAWNNSLFKYVQICRILLKELLVLELSVK